MLKGILSKRATIERLDYLSKDEDPITVFLSSIIYKDVCGGLSKDLLILEVGCGYGWGANQLSRNGFVVATDVDTKSIEIAKRRYRKNKRLKFKLADSLNLPFKSSTFDAVIAIEIIEHLENVNKFLKETRRVLKKGGILSIATPNREHFGVKLRRKLGLPLFQNPYHKKEYLKGELKELLIEKEFRVVKEKDYLICLPIRLLRIIKINRWLINFVVNFTLPGWNTHFLLTAEKI